MPEFLPELRVGIGYDVHKLVTGRKLILGGVEIPYEFGLLGHSDADVLLHAICDALLGACGLGDIGHHFPDSDPAYRGISSLVLLEYVHNKLKKFSWFPNNIDATIVCQEPKLAQYKGRMKENIRKVLELPGDRINIKATTTEKLGFTGKKKGIATYAVCTIVNKKHE